MRQRRVLLIGQSLELLNPLLFLFFRAGFVTDVLVSFFLLKNKFISHLEIAQNTPHLLQIASEKDLSCYDLVAICDDATLKEIAELDLPIAQKLKLLPVTNAENFQHLFSKIGLSETLKKQGICTPDFFVVNNFDELLQVAPNLGFPLLLKPNCSSGGQEIFEFSTQQELTVFSQKNISFPRLAQKKIEGEELDLSAFYLNQKLIHFSYSKIEKTVAKFAPSYLRNYQQLATLNEEVFLEMQNLGKALGASGFVTISAIKSTADSKIYFFEADMRPNAWADHTKFFGDDLAARISDFFDQGKTLQHPQNLAQNHPKKILIPLCLRLSFFEVLLNRHKVWRFISVSDFNRFRVTFFVKTKYFLWRLNRIPTLTIRVFLPRKEHRKEIKFLLKKIFGFA